MVSLRSAALLALLSVLAVSCASASLIGDSTEHANCPLDESFVEQSSQAAMNPFAYAGPGAAAWDAFNADNIHIQPVQWARTKNTVSISKAALDKAVAIPAVSEYSVGAEIFKKYNQRACGPSSDFRGLTIVGYDMTNKFGLGTWLAKHPYLFGVMGDVPASINKYLNNLGLGVISRLGPKYEEFEAWRAAVEPELKAGRPALVLISFSKFVMHYVNVIGFQKNAAGGVQKVAILDPNWTDRVKLVDVPFFHDIMRGSKWVVTGPTTLFYVQPTPGTQARFAQRANRELAPQ